VRAAALTVFSLVALVACGSDEGSPTPIVERIDDAIESVEQHYGQSQRYFEISATLNEVVVIVAVDDATVAEQARFSADGTLSDPVRMGPAGAASFTADDVGVDVDVIFDRIADELNDPVIIDFAITASGSGAVLYDATIASESGGILLVLLGSDGRILGVQAQ
jgi:hypothetical protein